MSSINTNAAAMTALQTLKSTNQAMDVTQNRISTGYRVSEAAHNAAYWSIATTMRSDNNALSTVRDALGLGSAQVDIAYTAMDVVKETLDSMKKKIVAASQPDIDTKKIQEEIRQLQNDLQTYAKSATFSGGNWLDVEEHDVQKVVASFTRDADGTVSLETIDVNTDGIALFVNGPGPDRGLLQGALNLTVPTDVSGLEAANDTIVTANPTVVTVTGAGDLEWTNGATFSFDVQLGTAGTPATVTGTYDGTAWTFEGEPADVTIALTGSDLVVTAAAGTGPNGEAMTVGNFASTSIPDPAGPETTIIDFDITKLNREEMQLLLNAVDTVLGDVTTAASDLGAIKTRVASQQDFVSQIMNAVSRGIGQLVDADMSEESTRLQALQVQQQLGIQALSIANSNSQNILALFKG